MRTLGALIVLLIAMALGLAMYFYSGSYPVGADVPHSGLVASTLERIRDRGIAAQSRQVQQPQDLNDPKRISIGAGHYAAMCAVCHLAPGYDRNETAAGLNPHPPQLVHHLSLTPAQIFWIIKHGLRMTGMPAWGGTHSDEELWDLTAFVLQLPNMTPEQYRDVVSHASVDEDMVSMPMPMTPANAPP